VRAQVFKTGGVRLIVTQETQIRCMRVAMCGQLKGLLPISIYYNTKIINSILNQNYNFDESNKQILQDNVGMMS